MEVVGGGVQSRAQEADRHGARRADPAIKVYRRDDRLDRSREDAGPPAPGERPFTAARADEAIKAEPLGDVCEGGGRNEEGTQRGQLTLRGECEAGAKHLRYHELQDGVTEELEPLVRLAGRSRVVVQIRAVREGLSEARRVSEPHAEQAREVGFVGHGYLVPVWPGALLALGAREPCRAWTPSVYPRIR